MHSIQYSSYFHFPENKSASMFVHLHGKNRGLNWVNGVDHQTVSTTHCSQAHFLEVTPRARTVWSLHPKERGRVRALWLSQSSLWVNYRSHPLKDLLQHPRRKKWLGITNPIFICSRPLPQKAGKSTFWIWFSIWHCYCFDLRQTTNPFLAKNSS